MTKWPRASMRPRLLRRVGQPCAAQRTFPPIRRPRKYQPPLLPAHSWTQETQQMKEFFVFVNCQKPVYPRVHPKNLREG
jgi:hypothetical protein